VPAPEALHPALWRAHQLGRAGEATWPSGFAALDAELPGGGWPARTLTELLLPQTGIGELRLLAPVLAASARGVMLFDPPAQPSGWALAALGLDVRQWVLVKGNPGPAAARQVSRGDRESSGRTLHFLERRDSARGRARERLPAADTLWALEQALASGQAGVVLAWLPAALRNDALRRLQLAAQAHDAPAFLLRGADARHKPSVAPLRLWLGSAGPDVLRVQLLKRRGPPLARPLVLALPPVLAPTARMKALQQLRQGPPGVAAAAPAPPRVPGPPVAA
jgi:protein ImuA